MKIDRVIKIFKTHSKKTVWKYYAFKFFSSAALFSGVLIPFYTDWGHISLVQVQILQSWFMLWIFILEIPTGVIADRINRKTSIGLGAFIFAIGVLVYGSIPSFGIFLLGEFLGAVGVSLISGADSALLYDALKEDGREEESKNIFGRANSINLAGIFVAAPIGSLLASKLGLNAPMLLTAIPFFLAALIGWSIKEPVIKTKQSESTRYIEAVTNGLKFFLNHQTLRLIAVDSILVSAAAYFVIWLYQPLLMSINVPVIYFGLFSSLLVASEIIISSNFVWWEKLFKGAKNFLGFSAVITGLSFALVAIIPNIITIVIFIVIAGGFGLTRGELMMVYMNKFIESHQRATVLSSISMFRRMMLVILNPLVGFMADKSINLAVLLVGLLPLLVFLFSPIEKEMFEKEK